MASKNKSASNKFYPNANPGESYIYNNGAWSDISGGETTYQYGNYCIRL